MATQTLFDLTLTEGSTCFEKHAPSACDIKLEGLVVLEGLGAGQDFAPPPHVSRGEELQVHSPCPPRRRVSAAALWHRRALRTDRRRPRPHQTATASSCGTPAPPWVPVPFPLQAPPSSPAPASHSRCPFLWRVFKGGGARSPLYPSHKHVTKQGDQMIGCAAARHNASPCQLDTEERKPSVWLAHAPC